MARHLIRSDQRLRAIRPGDPRKRISDGEGLYLLLFVNGGAHGWRFSYSFRGKRQLLSLGTYPATGLALARQKAEAIRHTLAEGVDPSQKRKDEKAAFRAERAAEEREIEGLPPLDSFEALARDWFEVRRDSWAPSYSQKIIERLERDVFPWLGRAPVATITPPMLLEVLRRVEARGVVETAHRALENCDQIFRYGIAIGQATANPADGLKAGLRRPRPKHFSAITDPGRLAQLLRACDGYPATHVVRAALKLQPMLLLRPGEFRAAEWSEIDLDNALWTVPAARMKRQLDGKLNGAPHLVPLPEQAVGVLRELQPLTGGGKLVFRGERHHDRPMSDNTINAALRAMGYAADEVTAHGFRATARTILHERLGFSPDVIEAQLAHSVRDSLGRAYNRTEFVDQRRTMLQAWADYLDKLRLNANAPPGSDSARSERARGSSSPLQSPSH
jgi:integrase